MKYPIFGTSDWNTSTLGLGTMNLPADEAASKEIIRSAIDAGVNYIDLGDPRYDRYEVTLPLIHRALQDGYREKVKVSLGIPVSLISCREDFDKYLKQAGNIDFFYLAGLDRNTWSKVQELNLLDCLDKALTDGRIEKAGFAFHDHFQYLRGIVEGYDKWTFCQFRYSYMDVSHHPGTAGLKYAQEKGLAVIITEALLSGRLVNDPPESVIDLGTNAPSQRTLADWGFSWVLNHPEVTLVVSNMSTPEEVKENTAIAQMEPDSLTVRELLHVSRLRDCYLARKAIPCPTCRPCMPCPVGIDAPRIFELYNEAVMYGNRDIPASIYALEGHCVDDCTECGICAGRCGRKIPIPEWLKKAGELLRK